MNLFPFGDGTTAGAYNSKGDIQAKNNIETNPNNKIWDQGGFVGINLLDENALVAFLMSQRSGFNSNAMNAIDWV